MSEIAGPLPCKNIRFRRFGVDTLTAVSESRGGKCSDLPPTEKSFEDVSMIAATDTSAKTMTILQIVSEGPMESARESCEGEVRGLDLTTSQEACSLSSGSEGRGSEMNNYFKGKLHSLDES